MCWLAAAMTTSLDVVFFIAVPTVWVDAAAKVEGRSLIRIIPAHLLSEHQGHRWLQKGNIVRVYILRRHAELVMCLSFDRCLHVCLWILNEIKIGRILCLAPNFYHLYLILYLFDYRIVNSSNEPTEKTRKATKLRAEGRPHKKLAVEVLAARKQDIEKKLSVHAAHSTLLQTRARARG